MGKYGTRCEYGDCFACDKERELCKVLRPTYDEEESCPFYKYEIGYDAEAKADEETIIYAIKRIEKLKQDIKTLNNQIKDINAEKDSIAKKIREAKTQMDNANVRVKNRAKNN